MCSTDTGKRRQQTEATREQESKVIDYADAHLTVRDEERQRCKAAAGVADPHGGVLEPGREVGHEVRAKMPGTDRSRRTRASDGLGTLRHAANHARKGSKVRRNATHECKRRLADPLRGAPHEKDLVRELHNVHLLEKLRDAGVRREDPHLGRKGRPEIPKPVAERGKHCSHGR